MKATNAQHERRRQAKLERRRRRVAGGKNRRQYVMPLITPAPLDEERYSAIMLASIRAANIFKLRQ
jgi:hypothetical protein